MAPAAAIPVNKTVSRSTMRLNLASLSFLFRISPSISHSVSRVCFMSFSFLPALRRRPFLILHFKRGVRPSRFTIHHVHKMPPCRPAHGGFSFSSGYNTVNKDNACTNHYHERTYAKCKQKHVKKSHPSPQNMGLFLPVVRPQNSNIEKSL